MNSAPPHDRTPSSAAAERAARRAQYARQTPEEIVRSMPDTELRRNVGRGAPMTIAEQERRALEAIHIPQDYDLDIGV